MFISAKKNQSWIGIDFGLTSTKLVQLGRQAGQLVIQASWCIKHAQPIGTEGFDRLPAMLATHCESFSALRRLFSGKHCAAALPMAVSHFRLLDLPTVAKSEQADLVTEEMLSELECDNSVQLTDAHGTSELSVGYWPAGKPVGQDPLLSRYAAYAIPRGLADSLGRNLLGAGLRCRAIDAIPCALARAVQMLGFRRTEDAVLAVDLSHQLPLVVLVVRGNPIFVRCLRDVGMATILRPLCEEFQISVTECHQLLSRFGLPPIDQPIAGNSHRTMRIIQQPVNSLIEEVKRTVTFVKGQFANYKPTHVCLFGGGASIKNLPQRMGHELGLPVSTWSLRRALDPQDIDPLDTPSNNQPESSVNGYLASESPRDRSSEGSAAAEANPTAVKANGAGEAHPSEAIFGLAAGLSALAWESQPCT